MIVGLVELKIYPDAFPIVMVTIYIVLSANVDDTEGDQDTLTGVPPPETDMEESGV